MFIQQKQVILTLDEESNCQITPNARKTIATLTLDDVDSSVITLIVNSSLSKIGDELVFVFYMPSWQLLIKPENGLIYTSCSDLDDEAFSPGDRWVGHFFYDGEKFLNTYEDC